VVGDDKPANIVWRIAVFGALHERPQREGDEKSSGLVGGSETRRAGDACRYKGCTNVGPYVRGGPIRRQWVVTVVGAVMGDFASGSNHFRFRECLFPDPQIGIEKK
jgi:hypothetical protein